MKCVKCQYEPMAFQEGLWPIVYFDVKIGLCEKCYEKYSKIIKEWLAGDSTENHSELLSGSFIHFLDVRQTNIKNRLAAVEYIQKEHNRNIDRHNEELAKDIIRISNLEKQHMHFSDFEGYANLEIIKLNQKLKQLQCCGNCRHWDVKLSKCMNVDEYCILLSKWQPREMN